MIDSAFWDEIEKNFMEYENMLGDFRFPPQETIERYQLSVQTEGDVESNYHAYFLAQDPKVIIDYLGPMKMLGIPLPDEFQSTIGLQKIENLREKILSTIKVRKFSTRFVSDWGDYNFAAGALISFIQSNRSLHHHRQTVISSVPHIAERCIYAFWMSTNWLETKSSKNDAQYALADRIELLLNGPLTSLPKWKKEALDNMRKDNEIKPALLNLSKTDIEIIVKRYVDVKHLFDL